MKSLLILTAMSAFCVLSATAQQRTVLGIFAHPDDENMVGSVLAKYSRLGHKVYVIIATDGKNGTRVTKIPAGDELGRIRQAETQCACDKLGIQKPIFFSLERLDTAIGVRPYLNAHKAFKAKLKGELDGLRPDVIISFGPDGEYGHPEHIVVGSALQEVLLREGWVDRYPLYFPVDTAVTASDDPDLAYISEKYINAAIGFSDADDERYIEAVRCYVTQFTPKEMEKSISLARNDKKNVRYFRRFGITTSKLVKDLFR